MKWIRCLSLFFVLLMCFATTGSGVETINDRKLVIKNRAVVDAYCAYAYIDATNQKVTGRFEYHIEGWVRIPSGRAVTIDGYASKYANLYICLILADGRVWKDTTSTLRFNVPKELADDSFKVVYELMIDGAVGTTHLHASVSDSDLEPQTFYDATPKKKGVIVALTIPGPIDIKEKNITPPCPGGTSESEAEFDGVYNTRGFRRHGKDYALLFATNTYQDPYWNDRGTPIPNAEAIAVELLLKYGFTVDLQRNVTLRDISKTLAEYAEKSYQPGDQLLVYFAGHGVFHEALKEGYIAGTDSVSPDTPGYQHSYLSHSELKSNLDKLGCERVLLVLDVSYGGTFDDNIALGKGPLVKDHPSTKNDLTAKENQRQLDLVETLKTKTRWYLSAVGKEVVREGLGEHSPFAASLLTVLKNGAGKDGVLTIPEIEHQLPSKLQAELNKAEVAWREKYPLWDIKMQQTPASGPFGSGKKSDKAFVFIKSQK